jgi:uncharacterized protein YjbI with pentapeptide repeats
MQWLISGIAAGLGIAIVLGAWWLWWRLPKRQVERLRMTIRDPKARADVEDNFRKTITQLFGGIVVLFGGAAALIGAGLAYYGTQQTLRINADQARRSEQAARDLLISNQASKGFEQLGSDKIVVRLGGIYALEGVMNTSPQYHRPVLEALCAFIRDGTKTEMGNGPPPTDIQAALTVIGRRAAVKRDLQPDIPISVGMVAAIETDPLNLARARIPKSDLSGTNFRGAELSDANLSGADLSDAALTYADLANADLRGANLSDATSANVPELGSGTDLTGAYLASANLSDANLSGADFTHAGLENAVLARANLTHAVLVGAYLVHANLSNADLADAKLSNATLNDANLSRANVSQQQLDSACGTNVKLDPGLTIKRCPAPPP